VLWEGGHVEEGFGGGAVPALVELDLRGVSGSRWSVVGSR
jgi:hypothetical protein